MTGPGSADGDVSGARSVGSPRSMEYQGHGGTPFGNHSSADGVLDEVIELRLPAKAEHIPLVRMLTHGVVARADFGLDSIADAKMAVDEACAQLVQLADLGAELCCRFRPTHDGLVVSISTRTSQNHAPSERTFGWHVLTTLTDSVAAHYDALPGEPAGMTTIDLVLRARSDAG